LKKILEEINGGHSPLAGRIAELLDLASDIFCVTGQDQTFRAINSAGAALLGYTTDEIAGRPYKDFIHPDDQAAADAEERRLFEQQTSTRNFINRYLCKNGNYRWLLWNAKAKGRFAYAIAHDITEAKTSNIMFCDSQELAKIWGWRYFVAERRLMLCGNTMKMLGISEIHPTLEQIARRYVGDASSQFINAVNDTIQTGKPIDLCLPAVIADNSLQWLRTIGLAERVNNRTIAIIGVFQDVTENKLFAEALERERSNSIHNAKMAALGQMAGSIAHEINNPLAVLGGLSQDLICSVSLETIDVSAILKAAERIDITVRRIAKIVKSLKYVSRDGLKDDFVETPLATVVETTVGFCQERFKNSGIELLVDVPTKILVRCQPVRLSQLLLNLLNNAFDAVSTSDTKIISISATISDARVFFDVRDTGPGVPENIRDKIMEPFFTTKPPGQGTGIGLSISRTIASDHEGTIELIPGDIGAVFRVNFPLARICQD
jgi:PAS domain S-box-containing protein